MGVQAAWNNFAWGYSPKKARALENLATGKAVSVEQSKNKKGKTTQTVTYDLVTVSATFRLTASAGYNPLTEFGKLKKKVGRYAPLFLAGKKFMGCSFLLESVTMDSTVLNGRGRIIDCQVSIAWKEYRKKGKLMAQTGRKLKLKPGVRKYNKRKSALQVGASSAAKSSKKTKNKQMTKKKAKKK